MEDVIRILLDELWEHFIGPVIFWPLEGGPGAAGRDVLGGLQSGAAVSGTGPCQAGRPVSSGIHFF